MALEVGTLVAYLDVDDREFHRKLDRAEGGMRQSGGRLGGLARAAGVAVGAGLAVGAGALVKVGLDAVGAASNVAESTDKLARIVGQEALPALLEYADGASHAIGQSKEQALAGIGALTAYGKAAGLAGKDLGKFGTDLTTLASDLASFHNTSPEEAIEAIGAALRGEAEPIRKYNVLLDEATLKARAMKMGILEASVDEVQVEGRRLRLADATKKLAEVQKEYGKSSDEAHRQSQKVAEAQAALEKALDGGTGTLTAQQKILAAQAEIYAQTADAQGNFADTSDGLANSQRTLSAAWADAKLKLGEALLPAALAFTRWGVDEGIPMLERLVDWIIENKEEMAVWALEVADKTLLVGQGFLHLSAFAADALALMIGNTRSFLDFWLGWAESVLAAGDAAFGWLPGMSDKIDTARGKLSDLRETADEKLTDVQANLRDAADQARGAADCVGGLRDRLAELKDKTITVTLETRLATELQRDAAWAARGALPGRAAGGPVLPNSDYLVGEKGPEVLRMGAVGGTVIPNHELRASAGGTVRLHPDDLASLKTAMLEARPLVGEMHAHGRFDEDPIVSLPRRMQNLAWEMGFVDL